MAAKCEGDPHYFSKPWKLSDVILLVEEEKFHVHRAVLALSSPVFEKMFSSEFQEKGKNEVTLPDKKASEVEELLLMLYPSVAEKQITEENCYFLVNLANEYQIEAIVQRCENFMVELVKTRPKDCIIAMIFAEKYELAKLKKAGIEQAYYLTLEELKNDKMYNQMEKKDLMDIMEGIMLRQDKELEKFQQQCQQMKRKISSISFQYFGLCGTLLRELHKIANLLVEHVCSKRDIPRSRMPSFRDVDGYLSALEMAEGKDYCKCGTEKCASFGVRFLHNLKSMKDALISIHEIVQNDK